MAKILTSLSVAFVHAAFESRYFLARMTRRFPRFGKVIRKIAFEGDEMVVIPKSGTARTVELNIDIDNAGERNVVPTDLVKTILNRSERIFIMDFCLCRQSNQCTDYPIGKGCIFVGRGTERIPLKYGRFATSEEACEYIDECDRLGLVHIIGRNKLDSLWLHTGDCEDLMTICNCCPCCCLWNMARDIDGGIASSYRRLEGAEVSVDTGKCIGCGICMERCFIKAIRIVDGKCVLDGAKCRACGRCTEECPTGAITLSFDPSMMDSETERIFALVNQ